MNSFVQALCSELWAMEPKALQRFIMQLAAFDELAIQAAIEKRIEAGTLQAFVNIQDGEVKGPQLTMINGAAQITIAGPMFKQAPSMFELLGIEATSTNDTRKQIRAAMDDPEVERIQLNIDSPGGTVEGTAALAFDIRKAAKKMPVAVHAPDLMASAAMWIGVQATEITVGETATIGSIGVYTVLHDESEAAKADGVKVHVVSTGPLKGIGVGGAEVTDEQLASVQRAIDALTDRFVKAVAKGRGLSLTDAKALATGEVWIGSDAVAVGLADRVGDESKIFNAPTSAQPEKTQMADDAKLIARCNELTDQVEASSTQNADLRLEAAKLRQENAAKDLAIEAVKTSQITSVINANRDRITPEMLASVQSYAAKCDGIAEFSAFVASLPVQTREDSVATPAADQINADSVGEMTDDQKMVASWLPNGSNLTAADFDTPSEVN